MRALHWNGVRLELRRDHPEPAPDPGFARVRVALGGICSTDLQILQGYMAYAGVLGHEFVGRVVDGPAHLAGRRVVGEINFACGSCTWCARDLGRHCPSRRTMGIAGADGALADLVSIPVENLHAVPDSVPDEHAVFAEPLAAAYEILDQAPVSPDSVAVVLGDGKLGLLVAQVLAGTGATVELVGRHHRKLAIARELGLAALHRDEWQPRPVDLVVEATGSADGLAAALAAVRPRGTLVLKSTIADAHRLWLARVVIDEITIVGSRCGRFEPALRALERGEITVAPLIERRFPLDEGVAAFAAAARPGAMKVLVDCA